VRSEEEPIYQGLVVQLSKEGGPRVKAGSNTSTVSMRVVGGDENGSLESETVKYGHEFHGSRT
jgi:hypothetical protein